MVWPKTDEFGVRRMIADAGLEPLVAEYLRRIGRDVIFAGDRPSPLAAPVAPPANRRYRDPAFLELLQNADRGVICHDPLNVDPAGLVAQAALAWPAARIVVAATRIDDIRRLQRSLQRKLHRPVGRLYSGYHRAEQHRIVVGAYAHLGGGEVDLEHRDLVFAVDPPEMLGNHYGRWTLKNAVRAHVYALLRSDRRLTEFERDSVTAAFGTRELVIPKHGTVARPIEAVFLTIRGGPAPKADNLPDLLRTGVWGHPVRNRRVVKLAQALAANDLPVLEAEFTAVHERFHDQRPGRIGVLAGNVDHAAALAKKLPGWKLVSGADVDLDGMAERPREAFEKARRQPNRTAIGLIITPGGLPRVRRLDVLIRADGDVDAEPVASAHCFINSFGTKAALVVDFYDRHDARLFARSKRRRESYLDAGWRLPLELPEDLDTFLRRRPRL